MYLLIVIILGLCLVTFYKDKEGYEGAELPQKRSYWQRQYRLHKKATHNHFDTAKKAERNKDWYQAQLYYNKALQSRQAADSCWGQLHFGKSDVGHAQMGLNIAKKIAKIQNKVMSF